MNFISSFSVLHFFVCLFVKFIMFDLLACFFIISLYVAEPIMYDHV